METTKNNNIIVVVFLILIIALSVGVVVLKQKKNKDVETNTQDNIQKNFSLSKEDNDMTCAEVVTLIYKDDKYEYFVPDACYGEFVFVKFDDGTKLSIKDALEQKKVTAEELIKAGASISKEERKADDEWKLQTIPSGMSCAEVITTLYEDTNFKYTVPNPCYMNETYVVYGNGDKYTIKDALDQNKVKVEELISAGAKITKEGKVTINTWKLQTIPSDKMCTQVITTLYEDTKYTYTVSSPCYIEETYVVYGDGTKYNIKDALTKKKVTIDELIKAGAKISKEAKVSKQTWKLQTIKSSKMCADVITTLYEDDDYIYTVSSPCYIAETFVVFSDGTKYDIKEALTKKKVTIDELIKAGANIYKDGKVTIQ